MSATWSCPECDADVFGSRCPNCEPDPYDPRAVRELVYAARVCTEDHGAHATRRLRAALEPFEEAT